MSEVKSDYEKKVYRAVDEYNKGDFQAARKTFTELSENNYQNLKVHEMLSLVCIKLDDLETAEKEYNIYLELLQQQNPGIKRPPSFEEAIERLPEREHLEEEYDELMKTDPAADEQFSAGIPVSLSMSLMAEGHYDEAEQVVTRYMKKFNA